MKDYHSSRTRLAVLASCLLLLAFSSKLSAQQELSGDVGLGFTHLTYGELSSHAYGGTFSLAMMGEHAGFEASLFAGKVQDGFFEGIAFVGSAVLSSKYSAPFSAFVTVGLMVPFSAVPAGAGVRVRVAPRLYVNARAIYWVTYEGGVMFTGGVQHRF